MDLSSLFIYIYDSGRFTSLCIHTCWVWPVCLSAEDGSDQSVYPQRMDLNGDGVVTLDEFLDFCSSDPATLQSLSQLATTLWAEWHRLPHGPPDPDHHQSADPIAGSRDAVMSRPGVSRDSSAPSDSDTGTPRRGGRGRGKHTLSDLPDMTLAHKNAQSWRAWHGTNPAVVWPSLSRPPPPLSLETDPDQPASRWAHHRRTPPQPSQPSSTDSLSSPEGISTGRSRGSRRLTATRTSRHLGSLAANGGSSRRHRAPIDQHRAPAGREADVPIAPRVVGDDGGCGEWRGMWGTVGWDGVGKSWKNCKEMVRKCWGIVSHIVGKTGGVKLRADDVKRRRDGALCNFGQLKLRGDVESR